MPSRSSKQCQSRRKHSLGKLRRAHPASGATWNVQVVRGKMTSKCLWHACRALILGVFLMLLGAVMATVGYYADQLSVGSEIRGNATVRVKNESRGFHLNNLSYVGPIVMGFGGFIVVAACVMTFEARDSAAKVVPARFKANASGRNNLRSNPSSAASQRRANGIMQQKTRWDHHLGVFRTSPAETIPPLPIDRKALSAALIHFSKTIGNLPHNSPKLARLSHTGSVPNLRLNTTSGHLLSPNQKHLLLLDRTLGPLHDHRNHRYHNHRSNHSGNHSGSHYTGRHLSKSRSSRTSTSLVQRSSRESSNSLLHPGNLHKLRRHALSVDETGPYYRTPSVESLQHGSIASTIGGGAFNNSTIRENRIKDRTKRSDTAKRHILSRQKPVEKEDTHSPTMIERRQNSTIWDGSNSCQMVFRCTSLTSRTPSIDSRSIQIDLHSPEGRTTPRTSSRFNSRQSSMPSVEREFRSQLSVSSEPTTAVRQLSGQSSLEPCVLEESPEQEEKNLSWCDISQPIKTSIKIQSKKQRPDCLQLNSCHENLNNSKLPDNKKLLLYRSNSSRTFYRPKPKITNDDEQIYYINTTNNARSADHEDDYYDSLKVISERRNKILKTESETALQQKFAKNVQLKNNEITSQLPNKTAFNLINTTTVAVSVHESAERVIHNSNIDLSTTDTTENDQTIPNQTNNSEIQIEIENQNKLLNESPDIKVITELNDDKHLNDDDENIIENMLE